MCMYWHVQYVIKKNQMNPGTRFVMKTQCWVLTLLYRNPSSSFQSVSLIPGNESQTHIKTHLTTGKLLKLFQVRMPILKFTVHSFYIRTNVLRSF